MNIETLELIHKLLKLDLDIESLLVEVCLQGGDCDESTCRM